jgi:hypothetical protein
MVQAVRVSRKLEHVIEQSLPTWSLALIVRALQTLRGVDLLFAVTFAIEIGEVSRFESQPAHQRLIADVLQFRLTQRQLYLQQACRD